MKKSLLVINDIIAQRKFLRKDSKRKQIVVQIGRPQKSKVLDWECPFFITNIGMSEVICAYGIDSVHALTQAIHGARVTLEKSGVKFIWKGGDEGESGLPIYVTDNYGKEVTDHLCKIMDCELAKIIEKKVLLRRMKKKKGTV